MGSNSRHLLGYPEPYTATDQAEPDHEVVLSGAVEIRNGIAKEAWMDEEAGNTRDRVVLILGVSTRPGHPDNWAWEQLMIDSYSSQKGRTILRLLKCHRFLPTFEVRPCTGQGSGVGRPCQC